jgi:hypothetical protein
MGVALLILSACGSGMPTPVAQPTKEPVAEEPGIDFDDMPTPPLAAANGVEGFLGTFCWVSGCADMFGPPPMDVVPRVTLPVHVTLPPDVETVQVTAIVAGNPPEFVELDVNLLIEELPPATFMLNVGAWFRQGGDASFWWALEEQASPEPSAASSGP